MNQKSILKNIHIYALIAFYMYGLCKAILFKFSSVDFTFLGQQFQQSLDHPADVVSRIQGGNLIPFYEITRTMQKATNHSLFNLIGNVVIFIPFGFFRGLMSKNKKLSGMSVIVYSFGLSLILESAQAIFAIGRFDVDDLILNSGGGLLGFIIFLLCASFMTAPSKVN
ncbi:VanZ family protein [Paenibacillus harenae]|uniref:VanZ family protein n=1 Tax=Paenibacillus harenae TaxID=306543 RepID=UPI0004055CAF|nr:VanZ family protein [Paenibacillus harenae]